MRKFAHALTAAVAIGACLLTAPAEAATRARFATVVSWADGDSLHTSLGEVRLIGIDTPEIGTCGASDAKSLAEQLAPAGSTIKLLDPSSVRNRDKYSRLLRYVKVNGVDLGARQIRAGAKARYDGLDGYQTHPKQTKYRQLDANTPDYCGGEAPAPLPLTSTHTSYPPSSVSTCPSYAPIKGNRGSSEWIYHVPGGGSYNVTNPEERFATEADAVNAGYRKARN